MQPTKVLTVCLGNICRSPMAEGILQHAAGSRGIHLQLDSAGTGGWHAGEAPDKRAQDYMKRQGIDISALRARQFRREDLDTFDHILVMDRDNLRNVLSLCDTEAQKAKVRLMLTYWEQSPSDEVPDPYYGGEEGFALVYNWVWNAAQAFLNTIEADER